MSDTVIRAKNLGKKYSINREHRQQYVALRDVVVSQVHRIKERFLSPSLSDSNSQEAFWALQDISFEVKRGDRVGIIGQNGAGKSTLLKIISQITDPTTGFVEMRGRISSLLEVGTGFHPELTGRENIFLNGAVLGMTKREVHRKFDEIAAFAEVEKFLDTPDKHYSSGMYVRLAFSVAAHLEPEILIVDEVLAVGDIAFQKKCLGRIHEISEKGCTILFVSHNIPFVRSICNKGLLFEEGKLVQNGNINDVIEIYLKNVIKSSDWGTKVWTSDLAPTGGGVRLKEVCILDESHQPLERLDLREPFSLLVKYEVGHAVRGLRLGFTIKNSDGVVVCGSNDLDGTTKTVRGRGLYVSRCLFPGHLFNEGIYTIRFGADIPPSSSPLFRTSQCLQFRVEDTEGHGLLKEKLPGVMRPHLKWDISFQDL